ncbi:UDP-galactose/UDP-glucose transporter 3 [Zea mays]|uniref:UDP-galactose/UDP-glucose transporter 3 n=2 Tax=Zea mays TaxID=4577 RepID=A0A1D6LSL5_MAIZE|nr:UDP-galactose/UDP-glucose transporter 3 [Zea mays]
MIKLWSGGSSSDGRAPLSKYWGVSVTNTIGPTMGIEALKYISYPAQVLAKSSKMIPVIMLMGTLLYSVKYTLPEYFCTFLVAGGVSSFALLKTSSKTVKKLVNPNAPLGYTLCFLNLAFDGYTNSTQDIIKSRYPNTNPWDIMLGMNLWGTIYNAVVMFVAPLLFSNWPYADGFEALRFCQENPEVAWDIFLFCLCGAVRQNYIFLTISRFGALTNTTITTTRKFMSIVVSSVISGNPLSSKQRGSVTMVFLGLSVQIYLKWKREKGRHPSE